MRVERAVDVVAAAVVGALAGVAAAAFLESLTWATRTRVEHPALLWALPLFGLACGATAHHGRSSSVVVAEIHRPTGWLPWLMAPLAFVLSVASHLFGASVGRESAAVQMAAGLADPFGRAVRVDARRRRVLLIAAIAGGVGAAVGAPAGAAVFALEVLVVRGLRFDGVAPAIAASFVGDRVVVLLGVDRFPYPRLDVELTPTLLGKTAIAGVAFGLVALAYVLLSQWIRRELATRIAWPPLRAFAGGVAVVALVYVVDDRAYLGLSLPLITDALAGGAAVVLGAFALKLVFTSVSVGAGFQGGEVVPLFVIGATLGVSLADVLDAPVAVFASVGLVAVLGAASNTPLACSIIAVELFGWEATVPALLACGVAYAVSTRRSIYPTQR